MTTTKQHDFNNRLTLIASVPSSPPAAPVAAAIACGYGHNDANQRTRATQGDGFYWIYGYDKLGQVTAGKKYWKDGAPVAGEQFEYAFDDIGNRTSAKAGGDAAGANLRVAGYVANSFNQYTRREVPGAVDVLGAGFATNAVLVNGSAAARQAEYFRKEVAVNNGGAAVWQGITVSETGQADVTGNVFVPRNPEYFAYDADGNLTNDGHWRYVWDAENRLVRITNSSGVGPQVGLQFEYDWQGRRIHKQTWSQGVTTSNLKYLYDGWNLVAQVNASKNERLQYYVWGSDLSDSLQGAGGVGGLLAINDVGADTSFVGYDGNGNVAGLVRATDGTVAARYEYGPFGEVLRATGPMAKANPFRFSTKYQDDETGLNYYGYRYYDASMGRWLSRDPIEEAGGINLHSFARNKPVSVVDFFGLSFNVIPKQLPPGGIDPTNPNILGRTWLTKYDLLQFDAEAETVTCAHCVTLHVQKDYELTRQGLRPTRPPDARRSLISRLVGLRPCLVRITP